MTILRSREISSLSVQQSPSVKTLAKSDIVEPYTPPKNQEKLTRMQQSFSPDDDKSLTSKMGLGSDLKSLSGVSLRRSNRLVSKSNTAKVCGGDCDFTVLVPVFGGRRERKSGTGMDKREYELGSDEKVRVLEVKEGIKDQDVEDGRNFVDVVRLKREETSGMEKGGNGKRKLDADITLCSDLGLGDVHENGATQFLSLRSGKRVAKTRHKDGGENDGDKSGYRNDDMVDVKGTVLLLSDGSGEEYNESCCLNDGAEISKGSSSDEKGKALAVNAVMSVYGADSAEMALELSGKDNAKGRKLLSGEDKGKEKMNERKLLSFGYDMPQLELGLETEGADIVKKAVFQSIHLLEEVAMDIENQVINTELNVDGTTNGDPMERFKETARRNASRFAHFASVEVEDVINPSIDDEGAQEVNEMEDWPGPFSTAMKIMKDRASKLNVQQEKSFLEKIKPINVLWIPKNKEGDCKTLNPVPPSLQEKCLEILVKHADAIHSLDNVPDLLRHKLCNLLCDSRRMNSHIFNLLVGGSPTEVRIKDCSWLTEEEFTKCFDGCDTSNLTILQLDQCGRCLPDYVVHSTLAKSLNSLPALTTLALMGGCRISDIGLSSIVLSAPALRSLNLNQCSLLSATGIHILADGLGSILRELYIDDCQGIDAMLALPALKKLQHLEVLSLAGVQSVSDIFISKFVTVCGCSMKKLILTDCVKLTDSSIKVIAQTCPGLCALDLANLSKLTDSSIGFLANSSLQIQTLKLRRNAFSDEAIAAYVKTSGESFQELSLNNVKKVGHNTALSLAKHSKNLQTLDLSFCRDMTDEAMGVIVDSCLSLSLLKIFGCTQVTNKFLDGHSNPHVKIIGMKMTPILDHLTVPRPEVGHLHYSVCC